MRITRQSYRINQPEFAKEACESFKSVVQANRFLSAHKEVYNLFNLSRHSTCRPPLLRFQATRPCVLGACGFSVIE